MMLANALRGTGVIIAVLGLLDPAISLPWRDRPRVGVRLATTTPVPAASGEAGAASEAQREMARRVRARMAREFVVAGEDEHHSPVDAYVLVGGFDSDDPAQIVESMNASAAAGAMTSAAPVGASAGTTAHDADASTADVRAATASERARRGRAGEATRAAVPIAAIVPSPVRVAGARILGVTAPRSAHLASRFPITVSLAAHGLRGRASAIAVRADGLTLARATQAWTQEDQQARVTLEVTPIRAGVAPFAITVEEAAPGDAAARTRPASVGADIAVRITDRPLRVLFVEPRPSWTTRFIRLALAGDPRFRVDAQAQVSRGLAARTANAPVRLTASALAPFDAVIVGAPEQLAAPDVDALRGFARTRGGLIVFAPDRLPQGPYVDLLPADGFDERLLDTPQIVAATPGGVLTGSAATGSAVAPATARTTGAFADVSDDVAADLLAGLPLLASELALPRALRPGAVALARLQGDARRRPLVFAAPLGDGQVLFAGAMDAWRYRDRPQPRFDAFWRQLVFALGAQAPPPVEVTIEPQMARPGEAVAIRAVWRRDLLAAPNAAGPASVRASAPVAPRAEHSDRAERSERASAGAPASASASPSASASAEPIRLWPGDRPDEFRATLNAPAGTGVYAMSLSADSLATPASAPLLVSTDVRRQPRSWEALRARVEAQGGLVVTEDQIDRAIDHLRRETTLRAGHAPRHPWRSAWWIVPFAGCLGGEWLLRRRRGAA